MKTINVLYKNIDSLKIFCSNNDIRDSNKILLQIFTGIVDSNYIDNLLHSIRSFLPSIKIIGATTNGEIISNSIQRHTTVLSFSIFEKTQIETYSIAPQTTSYKTGKALIEKIDHIRDAKVAIMFTDGVHLNSELFIKAFNNHSPNLIVTGGLAGDDAAFTGAYVFTEKGIEKEGAVTAMLWGEELIVNTSYSFGWEEIGKELIITKSKENIVYTIDNIPAVEVYRKYLGDNIDKHFPEFPLILSSHGHKVARAPIAQNKNGSLVFAGDIKKGEVVKFGYGNIHNILNDRYRAYDKLLEKPIESIFIYSCMARKKLLETDILIEIAPLAKMAPVSGFFTYGEFYNSQSTGKKHKNYLYTQVMSLLSLSEKPTISKSFKYDKKEVFESNTMTLNTFIHLVNATTKELKKSKDTIQKYLDLVDEHIVISSVNSKGVITYVSKSFCKISGYSKEELIGLTLEKLKKSKISNSLFLKLFQQAKKDIPWHGEIKKRRKDGEYYWTEAKIIPNFQDDNYTSIEQNITNKKLIEKLSITDDLTDIYNRRFFNEVFPKVINRAKRDKKYLAFLIMDIDHFKQYNDTYGHLAGDKALTQVAQIIKKELKRADDYCFRFGGEEFAFIFHPSDKQEAFKFADNLRKKIEGLKIAHKANPINPFMTVSMGLICTSSQSITEDKIYSQADQLLYEAKRNGRNRVISNCIKEF